MKRHRVRPGDLVRYNRSMHTTFWNEYDVSGARMMNTAIGHDQCLWQATFVVVAVSDDAVRVYLPQRQHRLLWTWSRYLVRVNDLPAP